MAKADSSPALSPHLVDVVRRNVADHRLFSPGERLLVGVSGGVDSVALLHILNELAEEHGWFLGVAHLNHGLRGRDAANDARFVRSLAKRLGLAYSEGRTDIGQLARENGWSVEMAGRRARHEFFAATAHEQGCSCVVLAHHADDQSELFFLRLFRGSGEGLGGMKWVGAFPGDKALRLVRPLLNLSKTQLGDFARQEGLQWREDASNADAGIRRNLIRQQLLPLLRANYQTGIDAILRRTMDVLGAESDYLKAQAWRWLRRPEPGFGKLPLALQRRVLQLQLIRKGIVPDFALIEFLRQYPDRVLQISKQQASGGTDFLVQNSHSPLGTKTWTRIARNTLGMIYRPAAVAPVRPEGSASLELALARRGRVRFGGCRLCWEVRRASGPLLDREKAQRPGTEQFDAASVGASIVLRHWRPGDRFQPSGMSKPVKLQDLFTNAKIPRQKRHRLLVASTLDQGIFWVEGLRIAEPFKITAKTRTRLVWHCKRT